MKYLLLSAGLLAISAAGTTFALQPPLSPRAGLGAPLRYASVHDTAQVRNGQIAPNFMLLDDARKTVSLSSFRGKVVYLDFWGTWCRPCMQEMMEFAPALKKQFEGRDVVFLYVSVGDTEAKWKQVITEQHFTGPNSVHLHAISSYYAREYAVIGYPGYYLIGRDGRFIQVHATRPSDGAKTVAAIEDALNR